ncbi:MAG: hypothetical protein HYV07_33510 [Deltaproteobacteria bacterium]|nr:hypothetical protein [Deltaproteobacteria bacterium]
MLLSPTFGNLDLLDVMAAINADLVCPDLRRASASNEDAVLVAKLRVRRLGRSNVRAALKKVFEKKFHAVLLQLHECSSRVARPSDGGTRT